MTLTQITEKGIKDGEIVNADINASAAIAKSKLASLDIVNADINASAAIARTKLANVDLVDDTSPQLGGDLDVNGELINFGDSNDPAVNRARFGASADLEIYHDGGHSTILDNGTGNLKIYSNGAGVDIQKSNGENIALFKTDGAVELYHDNVKQLETFDLGIDIGTSATGNFGLRWGGPNYNYTNIWTEYGSGDLYLATGLKPKTTNGGFFSSYNGNFERSAIQINAFGGEGIQFYTSAAQTVTTDSAITVPERFRINPNGVILINKTSPTRSTDALTVARASGNSGVCSVTVDATNTTGTHANALIYTKSKNTYWNGLVFESSHGHIGALLGKRDSAGTDDQEIRMEIGGNGANDNEEKTWKFRNNGNLALSSGNVEVASGYGIDFSANQGAAGMSSELFDHYEEGTFTPAVTSGLAAGQISYNSRSGHYTRIGRIVYFTFHINVSSAVYDSGAFKFGGLPFTSVNDSNQAGGMFRNYTTGNFDTTNTFKVVGNSTDIQAITSAGDAVAANSTSFNTNNRQVSFSGFYRV